MYFLCFLYFLCLLIYIYNNYNNYNIHKNHNIYKISTCFVGILVISIKRKTIIKLYHTKTKNSSKSYLNFKMQPMLEF